MGLRVADIRAVLFDLDDTLINWRAAEAAAMSDLARLRFRPHGVAAEDVHATYAGVMEENFRAFRANKQWWYIGDRLKLLVERLGLEGILSDTALAEEFKVRVTDHLRLLDGALEALGAAREDGRKVAMLTNGPSLVQRPKVDAMRLERHFDFVGISGELGAWKPDHEAFRRVLDRIRVDPAEALMVGDSLDFDLEPARALGMQTCWVEPRETAHPWADVVVSSPGHLVAHLGRQRS